MGLAVWKKHSFQSLLVKQNKCLQQKLNFQTEILFAENGPFKS
mgnify:CR=1 FL=1